MSRLSRWITGKRCHDLSHRPAEFPGNIVVEAGQLVEAVYVRLAPAGSGAPPLRAFSHGSSGGPAGGSREPTLTTARSP